MCSHMYNVHSVSLLVHGIHGLSVSNPFTAAHAVFLSAFEYTNVFTPFAGPSFSKLGILCTSSSHLALLQVSEKEDEKATLLTMCNELMNKLEREGISL